MPRVNSGIGSIAFRTLRSEEHTSELQSRLHLVCRLLLEKKNKNARERGKMILYVSHNPSSLREDCYRVLHFDSDGIQSEGTSESCITNNLSQDASEHTY